MGNDIFLGTDPETGKPITHEIATHALAIAGPRTGKGACQIIPTLRQSWDGNVICIDPKGEAVKEAASYREKMGQKVVTIDPVPDPETGTYCSLEKYRTRFNPLDLVREGGAGYRDLMMISDGLVIPSNKGGGSGDADFFDKTSRAVIAGALAFILETAPPDRRHMGELRRILRGINDPTKRDALFDQMDLCTKYGELAAEAVSYVRREGGKSDSIYTTAAEHVSWLADEDVVETLRATDFDLNELRTGKLSLFLVLPPDALETHGRFLRLFVRCALAVMKRGQVDQGMSNNRPCLFVLDEFAKLGKIDTIAEDAGLMPGYGVHLFPILQGIGQLLTLYGDDGAEIFKGSAGVISVFGLGNDHRTAQFASEMCGAITDADIKAAWNDVAARFEHSEKVREAELSENFFDNWLTSNPYLQEKQKKLGGAWRFENKDVLVPDQNLKAELDQLRSRIGKPRFPPEKIREMTARDPDTKIAKAAFIFADGGFRMVRLKPYFPMKTKSLRGHVSAQAPTPEQAVRGVGKLIVWGIHIVAVLFITGMLMSLAVPIAGWLPQSLLEFLPVILLIIAITIWQWLWTNGARQLVVGSRVGAAKGVWWLTTRAVSLAVIIALFYIVSVMIQGLVGG